MSHEMYTQLDAPDGKVIAECPCCSADGVLYQYQKHKDGPATKVVMCANGDRIGPQSGIAGEGCPLYMPGDEHYRATIREAIAYWNDYSRALRAIRRKKNWERHSALREGAKATGEAS